MRLTRINLDADAVRETLFHEVFHLNDAAHGDWSVSALGNLYAEGKGVPQDYVEAARLYRLAAERGDHLLVRRARQSNSRNAFRRPGPDLELRPS